MQVIVHEGKTYSTATRKAKGGDEFVVVLENGSCLTKSKVYRINCIDSSNDPHITDDDGDDCDCSEVDHAILEPMLNEDLAVISVTQPVEKRYTLVVTDKLLATIEVALVKAISGNSVDFAKAADLVNKVRQS